MPSDSTVCCVYILYPFLSLPVFPQFIYDKQIASIFDVAPTWDDFERLWNECVQFSNYLIFTLQLSNLLSRSYPRHNFTAHRHHNFYSTPELQGWKQQACDRYASAVNRMLTIFLALISPLFSLSTSPFSPIRARERLLKQKREQRRLREQNSEQARKQARQHKQWIVEMQDLWREARVR